MSFWFLGKPKPYDCQTVILPGNVGTIALPEPFSIEPEDDTTIAAFLGGSEDVVLRVSSVSFVPKPGCKEKAIDFVRSRSKEMGHQYAETREHGVAYFEEDSEQNGTPLRVLFWQIGCENTVVILSATIDKSKRRTLAVKRTLATMPTIVESVMVNVRHEALEVDGRIVESTVTTVDPKEQRVKLFGRAENEWLELNEAKARELALKYGSGGELDPVELDRIFSRWMSDGDESGDVVANALGAAFGSFMVEQHGFRWMVLTDENGSEFCVRHAVGETTSFPRASVQKRIEDQCPTFFEDVFAILLNHIDQFGQHDE